MRNNVKTYVCWHGFSINEGYGPANATVLWLTSWAWLFVYVFAFRRRWSWCWKRQCSAEPGENNLPS